MGLIMAGTNKPPSTAQPAKNPSSPSIPGIAKYLDIVGGKRTLITISTTGNAVLGQYNKQTSPISVQGIISAEYSFAVKNDFEPLLKSAGAIAEFSKGANAFNQLVYGTGLSAVPYSPQIWMGADPLKISELTLHFVCYDNAYNDVHLPLMRLLAMSLPQGSGVALAGVEMGMLNAPPAVEIQIGKVIKWAPCFLESVNVIEKAPYTTEGYGMIGEAKITVIRRDYIFAEDFKNNSVSPEPRVVQPNPVKK